MLVPFNCSLNWIQHRGEIIDITFYFHLCREDMCDVILANILGISFSFIIQIGFPLPFARLLEGTKYV